MDNLNQPLNDNTNGKGNRATWPLIIVIILLVVAIVVAWQFTGDKAKPVVIEPSVPIAIIEPELTKQIDIPVPEPEVEETEVVETISEVLEPEQEPLPALDESDDWLKIKLPEITWRKELLTLIIDDDMIRRFVVFTDNFSQGTVAYEHSPFVLPNIKFSPLNGDEAKANKQNTLQWNEDSSKRFASYIELLRSMDSDSLVQWYLEVKPLIDEAYSELGYDDDFTNTLQNAITRVLDMELPKSSMELVQPSVMYKFANPKLESLPDSDKLLLRLGKENLLVMKSILLELHEKLAKQKNGIN
ncbi:DUF3014 domain-containing protein [Colwellia sp. MSW7]|uniref:DUF3014 domain-containing protein n=1 Tax=Colwellia maritima TaxID=2912588 RepID=A0ABS9X460_9GAMM|nr:DUF3014 domain-containing protein [Colwellia maritima]MCI2285018.1 DUF3014 domain-containing protein [Colwellia maritima]